MVFNKQRFSFLPCFSEPSLEKKWRQKVEVFSKFIKFVQKVQLLHNFWSKLVSSKYRIMKLAQNRSHFLDDFEHFLKTFREVESFVFLEKNPGEILNLCYIFLSELPSRIQWKQQNFDNALAFTIQLNFYEVAEKKIWSCLGSFQHFFSKNFEKTKSFRIFFLRFLGRMPVL